MGLIRRLREWRERVDGTLTGPAIETDNATVNGTTTTDALEAESIPNVADHIITSKEQLQSLPSNLSDGETVWIGRVEHDQLIEIDGVGDVTIMGSGPDSSWIKTADGADVGCFLFGSNSSVGEITVKNITLDGNADNQPQAATTANPIETHDVEKLTLENVSFHDSIPTRATGTQPEYTSCLLTLHPTQKVEVHNCEFDPNVTRHIESSCADLTVHDSEFVNAHERHISADSLVKNNRLTPIIDIRRNDMEVGVGDTVGGYIAADCLGVTGIGDTDPYQVNPIGDGIDDWMVVNNDMVGLKRTAIAIRDPLTSGRVRILNNYSENTTAQNIVINKNKTGPSDVINLDVTVGGNVCITEDGESIRVANVNDPNIYNNRLENGSLMLRNLGDFSLEGNMVINGPNNAINVSAPVGTGSFSGDRVVNPDGNAVRLAFGSGHNLDGVTATNVSDGSDGIRVEVPNVSVHDSKLHSNTSSQAFRAILFVNNADGYIAVGNVAVDFSGDTIVANGTTGDEKFNFSRTSQ